MVQRQRLTDTLRSVVNSVFGPPSPDLIKSIVARRCSNSGRAGRLKLADAVQCLPPKWGRSDFRVHDLRHAYVPMPHCRAVRAGRYCHLCIVTKVDRMPTTPPKSGLTAQK